jgi:flagellar basal body-associated protein FliL
VGVAVNMFGRVHASALACLPVLLLLNGCGDAGPACDSAEVRSSVVRLVADNRDNPLVKFAVENSSSIAEMLGHANAEAEKSAIRDKAKQAATYALDDNILVNSSSGRTATCTGVIGVSVGDTSAQKEVEFKVEQAADGKISVSVKPFLF